MRSICGWNLCQPLGLARALAPDSTIHLGHGGSHNTEIPSVGGGGDLFSLKTPEQGTHPRALSWGDSEIPVSEYCHYDYCAESDGRFLHNNRNGNIATEENRKATVIEWLEGFFIVPSTIGSTAHSGLWTLWSMVYEQPEWQISDPIRTHHIWASSHKWILMISH